jgi:hypothetical protein
MAKKQTSIDPANAIFLKSKCFIYHKQTIPLSEKSILINGNLSDEEAARSPYVFNSFTEAMKHLVPGTSDQDRMKVYIAPYVYWVDDPDDPKIRVGEGGGSPIGMHINCPYLTLTGLTPNPDLAKEVSLTARITTPSVFGFGLQHTGSSGSSALMLHHLKIQWGGK